MAKAKMPHTGHEEHLCYLANIGFLKSNQAEYKSLVKDSKFVCENCGRTAVSEVNLCKPVKM